MPAYTFHADPGHGWLAVPCVELTALRIAGRISAYSYMCQGIAYLEEDCDAAVFVEAYKQANGCEPAISYTHTNSDSRIRRYARFAGV